MKQPKALKILSLTELFERYGLYTAQAMLILYLINHLSFTDTEGYRVLGEFTALAYITPLAGGWISDTLLGERFSILLGGLCECIGYALLALSPHTLYLGLSFAIIGAALLKPNISSFLGRFYADKDERREAGFTLFYVGICLGITLSMFTSGYIQMFWGWGACFGAASFALALGISIFRLGFSCFENKGFPPILTDSSLRGFLGILKQKPLILAYLILLFSLIFICMFFQNFGGYTLVLIGFLFYIGMIAVTYRENKIACQHTIGLLLLFLISIVFWALLFQMFFAINVFTERMMDRVIFGVKIPAAVFLGFETFFVSLVGPLLAKLWSKFKITVSVKFFLALLMMGFGMQLLAWVASNQDSGFIAPSCAWLILFYAVFAVGDLFISPGALSAVSQYAPKKFKGLMMGGWFMSMGFGGKLSGVLANIASIPKDITNLHDLNNIYHHAFQQYAWIGFIIATVTLGLVPIIQKLLKKEIIC